MWFKQGQIEVDSGDESEFGVDGCGIECGDGYAKETSPAGILPTTKPITLNPLLNQSKPIAQLILLSHYNFSL